MKNFLKHSLVLHQPAYTATVMSLNRLSTSFGNVPPGINHVRGSCKISVIILSVLPIAPSVVVSCRKMLWTVESCHSVRQLFFAKTCRSAWFPSCALVRKPFAKLSRLLFRPLVLRQCQVLSEVSPTVSVSTPVTLGLFRALGVQLYYLF